MPPQPLIQFFVHDDPQPLSKSAPQWQERLPMNRMALSEPGGGGISHGEYFEAVSRFLTENDCKDLMAALGREKAGVTEAADLSMIHIHMEKHGQFYHPARIAVEARGKVQFFVVNVAVSRIGRQMLAGEFQCLKHLWETFPAGYVPRVYATGQVEMPASGTISMFLGEWFDGFHEFHITAGPPGKQAMAVWDPAGPYHLTAQQITSLYQQAAFILTYYYNPATGEQIYPWHHAAGDFVLKNVGGKPVLRLITVRQYAAMLELEPDDSAGLWNGLLIFFLNLSLRMRLDRLDGVGDLVWAADSALTGTVRGFLEGLAAKPLPAAENASESLVTNWRAYFSAYSGEELFAVCDAIIASWSAGALETPLVRRNLAAHITVLIKAMNETRLFY